jgi:biopolymer transport protein ExbD
MGKMNLTTTKKTIFLWALTTCFLLTTLSTNVAQNAVTKASTTKSKQVQTKSKSSTQKVPPLEVVVYQSGKIIFKGKDVAFDDIKKEVQRVASTFKNIPDKIPMKTVGEVGMGTRQEVETRISEGIAAAKWARKKATSATKGKSSAQAPKRIDFVKEKSNALVWEENVAAHSSKVFVFAAKKGQKLSLSFIDDTKQGSMDLGKVSIEPNTDPYTTTIDVTKDYRLSVSNNSDKATSFRIFIGLEDPKTAVKNAVKKK